MAVTVTMDTARTAVTKLLSLPTTIAPVGTTTIEDALRFAVVQHNDVRPNTAVEEFALTASTIYYNLATKLDNWDDEFSNVVMIECPAVDLDDNLAPTYLDDDTDYDLVETSEGKHLRLRTYRPVTGDEIRIKYTYPNAWALVEATPPAEDYYTLTVPNEDLMPLYWLTASLLTDPAGAYYARVFAADQTGMTAIDWAQASRIMTNLSKSYYAQYHQYATRFNNRSFVLLDAKSKYPYPFGYDMGYLHH